MQANINPNGELGWSIANTAKITGESEWTVKQKLRAGIYRAKKSGRRTIVIPASVHEHFASLPDATFLPPSRKRTGFRKKPEGIEPATSA